MIEDGLSPAEVIHQSVKSGQLATKFLLPGNVTRGLYITNIIDGDHHPGNRSDQSVRFWAEKQNS